MTLRGLRPTRLLSLALLAACLSLASGQFWNPLNDIFRKHHWNYPRSQAANNQVYCNMMMWDRWIFWKFTNTFIHDTNKNINDVCKQGGISVGGFRKESLKSFNITICTFNPLSFSFNGVSVKKKIILSCLNGLPVEYVRHEYGP